MHGRYMLNVILLAVALSLITHLLLTSTTANKADTGPDNTSDIDPDIITAISMMRAGREPVHFARQGKQWRIRSPLSAYAKTSDINPLIQVLQARGYVKLGTGITRINLKS